MAKEILDKIGHKDPVRIIFKSTIKGKMPEGEFMTLEQLHKHVVEDGNKPEYFSWLLQSS